MLVKPKQTLRGPGNIQIPVIGMFQANLSYRRRKVTEPVYVVPDQTCPLLSRNACVALGLISRTDEEIGDVTTQHADFKTEFPSLFTGLGKVKTEVHITLQPDAKPFAFTHQERSLIHYCQRLNKNYTLCLNGGSSHQ